MSNLKFNPNWWTKERVDNGLKRFMRDYFEGKEDQLPPNLNQYQTLIRDVERGKRQQLRLYPPGPAVLRYYESFIAAWWSFGYLVENSKGKRKWIITPEIEAMLHKIYDYRFRGKDRPADIPAGPKPYARMIGYPEHALSQAAIKLGLSRTKEKPWSEDEITLLDKYGYRSLPNLTILFKENGFRRSETAILLMRKRRMSHKASPFYSMNAVANLFGTDAHVVKRWIEQGLVQYEMKGTRRDNETQQNGDTHLIHKDWLYEFIVKHPTEFEIKKVDQLWFLHIVTKGEVKLAFSDETRMTRRTEGQSIEKPVEWGKSRLKSKGAGK